MLFRGSERYPDTMEMNGLGEDAGANLNGVTMRDQGFYYTSIHPESLDIGLDVLGDLLGGPRIEDIDVEREIILEEMMDEVDAQGRDIDLGNLAKRQVFGDHPLGLKIAGTPDTVRGLTRDDLREHHRRFYVAENIVVVAAGPVSRGAVVRRVEKAFGRLPRGERAVERPAAFAGKRPEFLFVDHEESQTELQLTFPCPPETHPDYLALTLIRSVLDDGLTSWLPLYVVERRGLAYSVHAGIDSFNDAGLFEIEAACTPGKIVPMFREVVRLLSRLRTERLPAAELARVKRRHRIGLDFARDDLNVLAGWYGGTELFRVPETFEERVTQLEAVTAEQIQDVARRIFAPENLYVCAVGSPARRAARELEEATRSAEG